MVSLKCGASRPTLRKWVTGYEQSGVAGLGSQSRRPKTSPVRRIGDRERNWILALRRRRLGSRRIQSELDRNHGLQISRTTIDKILADSGTVPLIRPSRNRKSTTRYARQLPGERVQMARTHNGKEPLTRTSRSRYCPFSKYMRLSVLPVQESTRSNTDQ